MPQRLSDHDTAFLPDVEVHSEAFRLTRQATRTAIFEDYVELIDDLVTNGHEARQVDIAARLSVSQPTVAKVLKRMAAEGLVSHGPGRAVMLSDEGRRVARDCRERHRIVETFLRALGVSPETARIDAEGIEHHVSEETLAAFERLIDGRSKD